MIYLKTLQVDPSQNLKLCREVLDTFKNFPGRSFIFLKTLQKGPQ